MTVALRRGTPPGSSSGRAASITSPISPRRRTPGAAGSLAVDPAVDASPTRRSATTGPRMPWVGAAACGRRRSTSCRPTSRPSARSTPPPTWCGRCRPGGRGRHRRRDAPSTRPSRRPPSPASRTAVERYALGRPPLPVGPPVVAVPTTAGTGAEVDADVRRDDGRRAQGVDVGRRAAAPPRRARPGGHRRRCRPTSTAATGLDAFVHAVEAVTGRRRNVDSVAAAGAAGASGSSLDAPAEPPSTTAPTSPPARRCRRRRCSPAWPSTAAAPASPTPSATPSAVARRTSPTAWPSPSASPRRCRGTWPARPTRSRRRRDVGRPTGRRAGRRLRRAARGRRRCPPPCGASGRSTSTPSELAAAMVADAENLPMYHNNCRARRRRRPARSLGSTLRTLRPALVHHVRVARRVSAITRIEISHHRLPLDPPFPASWDPQPRACFPATIVRVHDDAGHVGVGSGDAMYGFADYERYFLGEDPLDLDRHAAVLANIDFHAGRPWPLDVALWDLAGQIEDRPVWSLVGGRGRPDPHLRVVGRPPTGRRHGRRRPPGPASSASRRSRCASGARRSTTTSPSSGRSVTTLGDDARADGRLQPGMADAVGHPATVGRRPGHRRSAHALAAERRHVDGGAAASWRLRRPGRAAAAGRRADRRWRADPGGLRAARAAGPASCLDVFQPDCVCTQGITGLRRFAAEVVAAGKVVHAAHVGQRDRAAGQRPPDGRDRRRAVPRVPVRPAGVDDGAARLRADGDRSRSTPTAGSTLSDRPGLGCTLDEDALARTAILS